MPSPDVRPYVDLTLFDESAQNIYLEALDYARTALPEYQPREGTIESVLLQAFAQETQRAIVAINRLPGSITEILLRLLDVERNVGTRATATVKFSGQTTTSFVVPSGTRLYYQASTTSEPLLLETTAQVTATHVKQIASISQTGTTITVTTSSLHGLSVGDTVTISGTGVTALNVSNSAVQTVDTTGYTFTLTSTSGTFSATTGSVTPSNIVPATGFTTVQTTAITGAFNGLASGTVLRVLSTVPAIASAELASILSGGASAESDTEYFSRATSTLSRLSAGLITSSQIEQYVIEGGNFPDVYRVKVADNTNGERVSGFSSQVMVAAAPIDASASNLLSGLGDGSVGPTSPSYGVLDEVYDGVSERIHSSLNVSVVHPALVTVKVTADVALPDGLSSADVEDACIATLESYLSPNTWTWDQVVRVNELVVQLRNTTYEVGTLTYAATNYVNSVDVDPVDFHVQEESTFNRWPVASRSRNGSNVATVTLSTAHGITVGVNETLLIKIAGMSDTSFNTSPGAGEYVVEALSATGNTFTYANTGSSVGTTSESTGYAIALAKKNTLTGDLTILDPAPLVISGSHVVSAS